jgi:hypothetical protein
MVTYWGKIGGEDKDEERISEKGQKEWLGERTMVFST